MTLEEENEKYEILDNYRKQLLKDGYKKYVVTINKEFVPLIDSMSVEERNETINEIISLHSDNVNEKQQMKQITKGVVIGVVSLIVLIFFIPAVLWLVNLSFNLTQNSYAEMENNFEVLYHKKK
ncbi:MAG: hypothetical protein MJ180_02255 [Candidatus Gastranaerophilales bacterium]|nr:hypothetical protein [Candidatus Gastranaerophilales bacterium]